MVRYHGGKKRYAEAISNEIIKEKERRENKGKQYVGYCEPFVGMASVLNKMIDKLDFNTKPIKPATFDSIPIKPATFDSIPIKPTHTSPIIKCGDINSSLISMWKEAQKSWKYKEEISLDEFTTLKFNGEHTSEKGFYGHVYGVHGIYFSCYDKEVNDKRLRYSNKLISNMGKSFKDVEFIPGDYTSFSDLKDYIIYCDPPYKKQNIYYDDNHFKIKFNHEEFWEWCMIMSRNNLIVVSEYSIPDYLFDKVKIFNIKNNEKLFILKLINYKKIF